MKKSMKTDITPPTIQDVMQFLMSEATPEINGLIRTLDLELVSFSTAA